MAIAVYTSDLTDIFTDGTTTGWSALGGGASGLAQETDYFVQGTSCLSKAAFASATKGMIYNGGTITLPTDGAIFMWVTHQTANSLDLIANGGLQCLVGSGTGDFRQYYIAGADTVIYDDRWICTPINTTVSANANTGSPTATLSYFGVQATMVGGPTKGAPLAIDAIRYGRGKYTYTNGDLANGYATFAGAATKNDLVANRYGLIQLSKSQYVLQGLHELGSTATAVDFRDSNKNLVFRNTLKVTPNFNGISINNASSNVLWTNINISALGTVSRGNFVVNNNSVVALNTCGLTDLGTFSLGSNTTFTDTTLRRTDTITLNGATITNCVVSNSRGTSAVVATTLNNITGTNFVSAGTGHAVQLTSLGGGSMNWNNTLTGYAGTSGTTGNEAIYVNVGSGTLTINVGAGYSTPSIRTAGATVNVVAGQVTTKVVVKNTAGSFIENARVYLKADAGGPLTVGTVIFNSLTDAIGEVSDIRSLASNQPVSGWVRKSTSGSALYKTSVISGTINNGTGLTINVQMIADE